MWERIATRKRTRLDQIVNSTSMESEVISPHCHTQSHHFCVPVILSMLTSKPGLTLLTLTLLSIIELGCEKERSWNFSELLVQLKIKSSVHLRTFPNSKEMQGPRDNICSETWKHKISVPSKNQSEGTSDEQAKFLEWSLYLERY